MTLSINDFQPYQTVIMLSVHFIFFVMPHVVMLSVVMLGVLAPLFFNNILWLCASMQKLKTSSR